MIPVAEEEAPNVEGNTQISHSKNDPPQSFLNSPSSINTPDQIFEPSQFIMSYPEYLASMSSPSYASADPSQQPRVAGPPIAANNPPSNPSSYLPYPSYRYAPSQDMYYAPYNPMPTSSTGIFQLYEGSYSSNHPYNYNISSQSHLPPSQSAASIQMETAILRSFIEPNDKDSDRGLPPLSPSHHHSPHSTTRHHLEGTGGNSGDGGRMNKSTSNQNLAGSTGTHNNSNNSLNKSFDPLSIKDKLCPDFLSDLFQDYINNQIQYQQPVANNFQEAHALMKNILIKKNVKENLISYRTDTKRGKRDYKIRTYRITLIEGKGGIYFFSFGEIVTQQHPTGGASTIPSQSGPASGVKKRRNTEDSLSSRKSDRGRTLSSVDPPADNAHESEILLNLQNILTEDEEHLGYDLIQLDDMDQPPHHRHSNSLDTEGNHDDSSFLMNIPSDDEEPQRHRRKMSHDSVMECSSRVMSRENSHQSRLDQFTNAFSSSNSSSFPNKDYNFL